MSYDQICADALADLAEEIERLTARAEKAEAEVAPLARALGAVEFRVRRLHASYRGASDFDSCQECNQLSGDFVPWPCATVNALDAEAPDAP